MTAPTARRLGIVVSVASGLDAVVAIALAARRAHVEVTLFAMDAGVAALAADGAATAALLAADCLLIACATSVDARAVALPVDVELGSQHDHAALIATSDRLIAFT